MFRIFYWTSSPGISIWNKMKGIGGICLFSYFYCLLMWNSDNLKNTVDILEKTTHALWSETYILEECLVYGQCRVCFWWWRYINHQASK